MIKYCKCGCGEEVNNLFKSGHNVKNGHPRDKRIIIQCKECNKDVKSKQSKIRQFCSLSCASTWKWKQPEYIEKLKHSHLGYTPTQNTLKKLSNISKNMWNNFTTKERQQHIKKSQSGMSNRPTSFEKKIIDIINKYDLPYRYTGDGDFWIEKRNPDFINTNGKKIAIEVFYSYFKNQLYGSVQNYITETDNIFAKYGYKCIYIGENDIKNEQTIIKKIEV